MGPDWEKDKPPTLTHPHTALPHRDRTPMDTEPWTMVGSIGVGWRMVDPGCPTDPTRSDPTRRAKEWLEFITGATRAREGRREGLPGG